MPARWGDGGTRRARATPFRAVREIAGTQNNSQGGQQTRQLDDKGNLAMVKEKQQGKPLYRWGNTEEGGPKKRAKSFKIDISELACKALNVYSSFERSRSKLAYLTGM